MNNSDPVSMLSEKIDSLIRIQAALAVKDMGTQREKIIFLYSAGLGPSFIASLLGTTPRTVSVAMSKHKRSSTKSEEDDE